MTLDGFLTYLALLIAGLAVMPEHRLRAARLHLTRFDIGVFVLLAVFSVVLVLVGQRTSDTTRPWFGFSLYPAAFSMEVPKSASWKWAGLAPDVWALIVLTVATWFLYTQATRSRIPPQRHDALGHLVDELLLTDRFDVLTRFLDSHERVLSDLRGSRTWRSRLVLRRSQFLES